MTRDTKTIKVSKPEKRQFNGHEFDLRLTTNDKNKAKGEAKKYRKRGFHTRVIELHPGVFSVYRRSKTAERRISMKDPTKHFS